MASETPIYNKTLDMCTKSSGLATNTIGPSQWWRAISHSDGTSNTTRAITCDSVDEVALTAGTASTQLLENSHQLTGVLWKNGCISGEMYHEFNVSRFMFLDLSSHSCALKISYLSSRVRNCLHFERSCLNVQVWCEFSGVYMGVSSNYFKSDSQRSNPTIAWHQWLARALPAGPLISVLGHCLDHA